MGVNAGADCGAAQSHLRQGLLSPTHPRDTVLRLAGVAAELLAQAHRRRVLQVGPARLDDRPELVGFRLQCRLQRFQRRRQVFFQPQERRQVDCRRDHVVGRLAQVDVVVGVHQPRTQVAAQDLRGPVGDHLVGVGVGRRARPGLEDVQHEMVVVLAVRDLLGRLDNGVSDRWIEDAEVHIGLGGGQLDQPQRPYELPGKAQVADGEVQNRPHGRRAVKSVGGDFHLTHGIAFDASYRSSHRLVPSSV